MLLFNNCSSGRASSRSPPRRQKREQRATQTEEAPPPSRPTAAVPPVQIAADSGAGASSNGASNLLLNSAAAQPLSSTAAVPVTLPSTLERQWLAESFESLFRRARDLKQRVDAAIRGRRPTTGNLAGNSSTTAASAGADVDSNAKRHFLLASVLFLAGCWAVEERRSPGSDNGSTKRTYHEISQFIRHFIRVFHERHGGSPVSNSTSNSGSGSVAVGGSKASGCLVELCFLMLKSIVDYRQFCCYRPELAASSSAFKAGRLPSDQQSPCIERLLLLYQADETWRLMTRLRQKMRQDTPQLQTLEEEVTRRCGVSPSGPADRFSHLLCYLHTAVDVAWPDA
ncbi:hypothetical protein BOX15_Mlig026402g1 [Macrostomum lignano]|uniref:Uncharacterized protein n=1 Tax=Macrostomum lignano TaxID=282301 RepID=A0A267E1Y6_9PLAT|nr:hypothetical protein BOX15_Mlig026402g1 [Macrostomum lignano]